MSENARHDNKLTEPIWANQDIVLYHGTAEEAALKIKAGKIDVHVGESGKDFGRGFYTTTVPRQADKWAKKITDDRFPGSRPMVVRIEMSRADLADLSTLAFVLADDDSEDFWSFVRHCRRRADDHGAIDLGLTRSYDAVYGPLVLSWEARKIWKGRDQISFHTAKSEEVLNNRTRRTMMEVL